MITIEIKGPGLVVNNTANIVEQALRAHGAKVDVINSDPYTTPRQPMKHDDEPVKITVVHCPWGG